MDARGWTAAEVARRAEVQPGFVGDLLRFRGPRTLTQGVVRVAIALEIPVDDVWTEDVNGAAPKEAPAAPHIDFDAPPALIHGTQRGAPLLSAWSRDPETSSATAHARDVLLRQVETLSEREALVVRMRYGLDDGHIYTLDEVGQICNVGRERVRQIEAKAVRKLQHPTRSNKIAESLGMA